MNKRLFNQQNLTRRLRLLSVLFAMLLMPLSAWADSYFGINTTSGSYWVTDETATDVLGDGSHKITYDATNNVLTLNGINLSFTSNVSYDAFIAMVDQDHPTLTVHLVGDNTLTLGDKACFFNGWGITFTTDTSNPGTLTINSGDNWGGALFIYNPTSQSMNATYNNGLELIQNGNTYTIQASQTNYNITVAGTPVTSQNAGGITGDGITGTVTYNATQHALTLEGATIAGSIVVTNENNLTINVKGENIINAGANSALKSETQGIPGPTITFVKAGEGECSLELNSTGVTVISTKFGGLYYTNLALVTDVEGVNYDYQFSGLGYYDSQSQSTLPVTHATITSHTAYDLWIGETQVTSANAADVLGDGKVSFTKGEGLDAAPTDTLTLNSATLTVPVKVGLPNLVIDVQGANTITTDTTCIQNIAANFVPSLTFKSTSDVVGNLTLTDTDEENYYGVISENFYSNNTSYYTISKELALVMLRYGNYTSNTSYFTAGEVHNAQLVPSYGVQVGDIQIYAGNAADVFEDGTVSFDKTTNTLTLNGADKGALSTWLEELNVELIGNNKLTEVGSYPVLRSLNDAEVIINIQSTGVTKGSLMMSQPYTQTGKFYDGNVTVNIVQPLDVISGSLTGNDGNENTVVIGESYNLWVGGNRVTSANSEDILSDYDGTMSFDAANNTLTVSEVGELPFGIESKLDALTIKVSGVNTIYSESGAAISYTGDETGTLTFVKDADSDLTSLTLTAYGSNENIPNKAIAGYALDNITITTPMRLTSPTSMDDMLNATSVTIADYSETYDIKIAGTTVTDANKDDVLGDGTVSYEYDTNTLLLNNATIIPDTEEWGITYSGTRELFAISLNGDNTVKGGGGCGAICYSGPGIGQDPTQVTPPELQFIKTYDAQPGSLTLNGISGFGGNISFEDNLVAVGDLTKYNQLTYIEIGYRVWVDGDQLSEHNTVSGMTFSPSNHTLSLSGIVSSKNILTSLESLTVRITGTNKLGTIGFDGDDGDDEEEGTLTFVKNDQSTAPENSLTLENEDGGGAIYGFTEVNIQSPLMLKTPATESGNVNWDETPKVVISDVTEVINYDLTVAGTPVTSKNAANVQGDDISGTVSYANGVLTLNEASLASGITSSLDQLKIVLKGESSIAGTIAGTGTLYFAADAADAKLTFTTTEPAAVSGFTEVKYLNGLRMKSVAGGFDLSIPSAYNLMVNDVAVTSDNRRDVFGDGGSVIYDGEYTLILTNAELTQKIELGSDNTLDQLYIHLAGQENTITSADNVIVANAKDNMELHFVTNGNSPGKLVYTSTNASNPTLEDAFTGFSKVSFDNELEAILSGKTITFAQKIEPIINADPTSGKSSNANVDLTDANTEMEQYNTPGANLNNMIVGDILFTLNDDGTKDSPDGYDGSNVVINSEVSDEDLAAAMNLEPGSDAFNEKFTGLTFKLPASTGTISIEAWSLNGHQMCVKIGDQTATYITLTDTPTTYDIDYTCSSDTYVYIYLPKASSSSAPRHVRGRIGPKSGVSGGLGNISVSSNSMVSAASSQPASNYMLLDRMAADAIISSVIPGEGLAFNDASITDLEDDMFLTGGGASSAPRRAAAPALKISSNLPFIDMRGTSIKNMEVSRLSGPFNGVPENVFIYMPAGNTTSEKNVVIGDVCDRMELKAELPGSGENEAKPFKVSKNFTAAQATLMRTFAEGGDESKATIYLPYAIPQEDANLLGQFFEFDGIDGGVVKMTKVTSGGLKANKPYIFQAKAGGVVNPEVKIVTVQGMPGETEGFKGVYEQTTCGGDNWYGYAAEEVDGATIGQFVKLGSGASIAPFRAYMVADGNAPSYAIRWGGVDEETTAIEEPEIKTVNERKPVEGWYTLTGARLMGQPTKPGLYIYNGRTVVVK